MSQSAEPSASATPSESEEPTATVTAVEAPTKFVALKSEDGFEATLDRTNSCRRINWI